MIQRQMSYIIYNVYTGRVIFSSNASWIVDQMYKHYEDLNGEYQKKVVFS